MSGTGSKACLHAFSLELNSREHIRQVSMPSGPGDRMLIQGYLGELEAVGLVEGLMLEIKGTYGVLSVDIREEELRALLGARSSVEGHRARCDSG
jgi:hypothetical protein